MHPSYGSSQYPLYTVACAVLPLQAGGIRIVWEQ